MKTRPFGLLYVLAFLAVLPMLGCGGSQTTQSAAVAEADSASPAASATDVTPSSPAEPVVQLPSPDASPGDVVTTFLQALKGGDEVTAEYLLTTTAREETAKHELAVQPPGAPNSTFQVGQVEYVTEAKEGADVRSTWTESDSRGNQQSYEIFWVLRKQPDGWRVAGMATMLEGQQTPLFLNFEDPQDMLQRWAQADPQVGEQLGATADSSEKTAAQPSGGTYR